MANVNGDADAIASTYTSVDLNTLLTNIDPKNGILFATSKIPSVRDGVVIDPLQTRDRWSFRSWAVPTAAHWWLVSASAQGLAAGQHSLGRLKTSASHGANSWWVHIDETFKNPDKNALGEYALVRNSLNSDTVPGKQTMGKLKDKALHDEMPPNQEFDYILDIGENVAARIKADEMQLINDFCAAYDLLIGGFATLLRGIPHQKNRDSLWRELWNRAIQDPVLRAVVPSNQRLFDDAEAYLSQISTFFTEICELARNRRGRVCDDSSRVAAYFVAWASDDHWSEEKVPVNATETRAFVMKPKTINVSISQPPDAGISTSQIINRSTVGTLPRARRRLVAIEDPVKRAPAPALTPGVTPANPVGSGTLASGATTVKPDTPGTTTSGVTPANPVVQQPQA